MQQADKLIQWGVSPVIASGGNLLISFPIAYPVIPLIYLTFANTSSDLNVGQVFVAQVRTISAVDFTIRNLGPITAQYHWLAIY